MASPEQLVERVIAVSTAHVEDQVSVGGPYGLATMIALCRKGFARVECAQRATCAGADDASDLLLIVGPMSEEALAATVRRLVPLLRDGGRLVIQPRHPGDAAAVRNALAAMRRGISGMLVDNACGRMVTFILSRPARLTQAA
jgi:hypothetical protein